MKEGRGKRREGRKRREGTEGQFAIRGWKGEGRKGKEGGKGRE